MAKLQIDFYGMAMFREGRDQADAWLIDTGKVKVDHAHEHSLRVGDTSYTLRDGVVVTFEQAGETLSGAIEMAYDGAHVVDLDAVLPSPVLRDELAVATPTPDTAWRAILAAWIRLPGGSCQPKPVAGEVWTFPGHGDRLLSETASLYAPVGDAPVSVRFSPPIDGVELVPVPLAHDRYVVEVSTDYTNAHGPSPLPTPGEPLPLDEVLLLYACVTAGPVADLGANARAQFGPLLPTRVFSQDEIELIRKRIPESDPVTICPFGRKRYP